MPRHLALEAADRQATNAMRGVVSTPNLDRVIWDIRLPRGMASGCIFCRMVAGEIGVPHWIAQTDRALAFLDIQPIRVGHALVIPRRHSTNLADVTPEDWTAMSQLVLEVSRLLRRRLGTDGENLLVASGPGSEQTVLHLHVHVIPRKRDDDLHWDDWWRTKKFSPPEAELLALARKIRGESPP